MPDTGWITVWALKTDALPADTMGRAIMSDSFVTNAKIADTQITAGKFASGKVLATGVYDGSTYGICFYA